MYDLAVTISNEQCTIDILLPELHSEMRNVSSGFLMQVPLEAAQYAHVEWVWAGFALLLRVSASTASTPTGVYKVELHVMN